MPGNTRCTVTSVTSRTPAFIRISSAPDSLSVRLLAIQGYGEMGSLPVPDRNLLSAKLKLIGELVLNVVFPNSSCVADFMLVCLFAYS